MVEAEIETATVSDATVFIKDETQIETAKALTVRAWTQAPLLTLDAVLPDNLVEAAQVELGSMNLDHSATIASSKSLTLAHGKSGGVGKFRP